MAGVDLFGKCEPASVVQTEKTQKTVYTSGPQAAKAPDVREPSTGREAMVNGSLDTYPRNGMRSKVQAQKDRTTYMVSEMKGTTCGESTITGTPLGNEGDETMGPKASLKNTPVTDQHRRRPR
ncbi:unnamed protein product [Penicillium pancosmium]